MANLRVSTLSVGFLLVLGAVAACSDEADDQLRRGGASSGASSGASGGSSGGSSGASSGNPGGPSAEEVLFRKVEPDLEAKCGGQCHTEGTYKPTPPKFLEKPDAYKSIKAQPGVVVADFYQSSLLTKGAHAGPAVGVDPTFEQKVIDWLKMESAAIQALKKPTTDPFSVKTGPNEVDLSKAAIGGLTGVKLKFNASMIGGILSLDTMQIVAGPGPDVHILKPKFIRVLPKPNDKNISEFPDPGDSFSNADQTVPNSATTTLAPGSVIFAGAGWVPFDINADKLRIEVEKLEPGKVAVIEKPKTCKDPAGFATNVLNQIRTAQANAPCQNCHNNGTANLTLGGNDNVLICNSVLSKINEANVPASVMIQRPQQAAHTGGVVQNPNGAAWATLITNAYNTYMKQ
ncbi:MAG: hypothetical protein JST00_17335 [Deltaproteobacteria bacterium]|nr:hypothetical protein [Deltaproteobacteria bacterium]